MSGHDSEIKNCRCPKCGGEMTDAWSDIGERPGDGDFCICIECAAILCFNADLSLRRLTKADLARLLANKELCADLRKKQLTLRAVHTLYSVRN